MLTVIAGAVEIITSFCGQARKMEIDMTKRVLEWKVCHAINILAIN